MKQKKRRQCLLCVSAKLLLESLDSKSNRRKWRNGARADNGIGNARAGAYIALVVSINVVASVDVARDKKFRTEIAKHYVLAAPTMVTAQVVSQKYIGSISKNNNV